MSALAHAYRAPAAPATTAHVAGRVTREQVALIAAASLTLVGAIAVFAPRPVAAPAPLAVLGEAPFTSRPLPLPPVVRVAQRPTRHAPPPPPPSPQARSGMETARGCVLNGGSNAAVSQCIVNALRDSASTEAEQRMLCVTYRQMGDRANSVACMRRYLIRYPDTRYAVQFGEYLFAN